MRTLVWILPVCLVILAVGAGQAQSQPVQRPLNLMPLPSNIQLGSGQMLIDQSFTVGLTGYRERRLENAAQRFLHNLSRRTGMPLNAQAADPAKASLVVQTDHASKEVQEPGEDESYVLQVTASGVRLSAAPAVGGRSRPAPGARHHAGGGPDERGGADHSVADAGRAVQHRRRRPHVRR